MQSMFENLMNPFTVQMQLLMEIRSRFLPAGHLLSQRPFGRSAPNRPFVDFDKFCRSPKVVDFSDVCWRFLRQKCRFWHFWPKMRRQTTAKSTIFGAAKIFVDNLSIYPRGILHFWPVLAGFQLPPKLARNRTERGPFLWKITKTSILRFYFEKLPALALARAFRCALLFFFFPLIFVLLAWYSEIGGISSFAVELGHRVEQKFNSVYSRF